MTSSPLWQRAEELLADRALEGLDAVDGEELRRLVLQWPGGETDELDLAAAEIHWRLLSRQPLEPLPEAVARRVVDAAR